MARLAFLACILAFIVIGLGAFTRLVDAGLGCPDWPGCYGHLTVPVLGAINEYKAWAEMIHRYVVGLLSLLILSIVMMTFKKEFCHRGNIILALCLVLLLVYQISLGRWTVTLKLMPIIVTQHLLGGFLILSILWLIYLNNKSFVIKKIQAGKFILWMAVIGLLLLLVQIFLGAWTSTNYASLSCPDFPFCSNRQALVLQMKEAFNLLSPIGANYEGGVLSQTVRQTIQMDHRFGALILTVYLLIFAAVSIKKFLNVPELLKLIFLMLGLLGIQICLGMMNVIFKLPVLSAVCHTLVAVLLLLTLITLIYKLAK